MPNRKRNRKRAFNRWIRFRSKLPWDVKKILLRPKQSSIIPYTAWIIRKFTEADIEARVPAKLQDEAKARLAAAHAQLKEYVSTRPELASIYNSR